MNIIENDSNATDLTYINIQKDLDWLDPPDLARRRVEELYKIAADLLDKKFNQQIKHDFAACYSELYFAAVFRHRLNLNISHPSDKGPDFYISDIDCWVEVTTVRDGQPDNLNSVPPKAPLGEVSSYPERQVILRLASGFYDKARKIANYKKAGIIMPDQKVIICISGGWMSERIPMRPVGGYPQIAKALLPIGDLVYWINKDSNEITNKEYKYRPDVKKVSRDGEHAITTDFFLNPEYSYISGVLYSYANASNPVELKKLGCDFFLMHNPIAENPIEPGTLRCGQEYRVDADTTRFTMLPVVNHEDS